MRNPDLTNELAELLYDAAHEHCEDECTGGGRPWCERVAARLTDEYAPLAEIANEREMQDDKWGEQNHSDGTGGGNSAAAAVGARLNCQIKAKEGTVTRRDILREEVAEAFAEVDPAKLRAELIQVAAVATAWVEAIDRRPPAAAPQELPSRALPPALALEHVMTDDGCYRVFDPAGVGTGAVTYDPNYGDMGIVTVGGTLSTQFDPSVEASICQAMLTRYGQLAVFERLDYVYRRQAPTATRPYGSGGEGR